MELYNNPYFVIIVIAVFAYFWVVCPGREED